MFRGIPVPTVSLPIAAFALWVWLFLSYVPTVQTDLDFPRQILQANFFVSNIILVLTWFLCGRVVFAICASAVILLTTYLVLDIGETGLWVQVVAVLFGYLWLEHLSRQIENEKLVHLVNREKFQAQLNLAQKALEEKDHLHSALERKLDRLKSLREFSDRLKDVTVLKDMAGTVLQEVAQLMPRADQALLFIVDPKTQELGLVSHFSRDSHYEAREKRGNEYDDWVIRRSQPLLIEDIKNDYRFSLEQQKGAFRSVCLVPLVSERKVFGVLHMNAVDAGAFHTDDLRFMDILADISAVALRNVLLFEKTRELAIIDSLTECYLFRYVQDRLSEEIQRALRTKTSVAVIMADIDHFKRYNDELGHTAGDTVLKTIAEILRSAVGPADIVGRYGGEEFIIVLPQKEFDEACEVAETIRKKVESRPFDLRRDRRNITISLGVAVFPHSGTTKEELIWKADKHLYEAKKKGRNQTCGAI